MQSLLSASSLSSICPHGYAILRQKSQAESAYLFGDCEKPRLIKFHLNDTLPATSPSHTIGTDLWGAKVLQQVRVGEEAQARQSGVARASLQLGSTASKWFPRMFVAVVLLQLVISVYKRLRQGEGSEDQPSSKNWFQRLLAGNQAKKKKEREAKQLTGNWHPSTKGTLMRKFRVPTIAEGHRVIRAVAGVLAEDDLFRDARTHKGCRIQRESAHGESVCCNNVRALFDELPTPHVKVEITVFPPGPLTAMEYQRAAKLEGVLRLGLSI